MFGANKKSKTPAKAFTIIEVMIVLAIAGLIMVIVFIAVPALERDSRDHHRKQIVNSVYSEINTYAANNQGCIPIPPGTAPCDWGDFYKRYIKGKLDERDPSTGLSVFNQNGNPAYDPTNYDPPPCGLGLNAGDDCTDSDLTYPKPLPGIIAVVYDASCSGEVPVSDGYNHPLGAGVRRFAVLIGLERQGTHYCVSN